MMIIKYDGDDEFAIEDELEGTNSFEGFIAPISASSLVDDESVLDEENENNSMMKRDYNALSKKMNMLVRHSEIFSTCKFEHMMTVHESMVKTLLFESKILFEEHEKLVTATNVKMDVALNDVKKIHTLIFNDNTMHNSTISNSINTLVSHYDIEAKISDINATENENISLLKA
ncbi:unnamed protein product [Lactuca virosa]|uniref:Uncharacterized protein n=1 Tax=Lactuca virosa TaxID=75947 RepID=A0AAU9MQI6_9ASTR|nr:unnamed protein product [Lactuca virosa]